MDVTPWKKTDDFGEVCCYEVGGNYLVLHISAWKLANLLKHDPVLYLSISPVSSCTHSYQHFVFSEPVLVELAQSVV